MRWAELSGIFGFSPRCWLEIDNVADRGVKLRKAENRGYQKAVGLISSSLAKR